MKRPPFRVGPLIAAWTIMGMPLHAQTSDSCVSAVPFARFGEVEDAASVRNARDAYVVRWTDDQWLVAEDGSPVIGYSENGDWVGSLGVQGQGPGELTHPSALAVDPFDSLWVSDVRGRVVVFEPGGLPARTIVDESLRQVEGFSGQGNPAAALSRVERRPDGFNAERMIRVWDREGTPQREVGPGRDLLSTTVVNEGERLQFVFLGEDEVLVPIGWDEAWIERWGPTGVEVFLSSDSVWQALGLGSAPEGPDDGRPIALVRAVGDEGYWLMGAVRRLPTSDEERLVSGRPVTGGESAPSYRRAAPAVRDSVYDTAILKLGQDGRIEGHTMLAPYLWGFADGETAYGFEEDDRTGLVTIVGWRLWTECR